MENLENLDLGLISSDGLIDPNQLKSSLDGNKKNQVKEVRLVGGDGLMERVTTKVVINDGRELLT